MILVAPQAEQLLGPFDPAKVGNVLSLHLTKVAPRNVTFVAVCEYGFEFRIEMTCHQVISLRLPTITDQQLGLGEVFGEPMDAAG